ncbi:MULTISPECIES: DUF1905 domain-containing protein [unclassified Pedobacter]|uniref:DUF1905 domain-containing protein n=1 Tax=unclassified Pedobacter TaxID=2628915 RepID=UPI001E343FC1|nr:MULTISPECIES: DUF1905 domain-containing protein [unclassified Pedobacter]
MDYIIKDEKLELIYEHGKGAWTYHLRIRNSKNIDGKWGDIKVSGFVDNYKIEARNLAPIKGEDKMLSINGEIRKAINKKGGDIVTVTLYLLSNQEKVTEKEILETFKEAGVLKAFEKLHDEDQKEILGKIASTKSEDKQTKVILKFIDQLSKSNN